MRTTGIFTLLVVMALIGGCNPKPVTNPNLSLADSLLKLSDAAYNSLDAQKIADLYTDDGVMIIGNKTIWSKDSVYAFFKSSMPTLVLKKEYKSELGPTTITENKVQMQRYFTTELGMGDVTIKAKGLVFLVWEKQSDNLWKIAYFLEFAGMGPI